MYRIEGLRNMLGNRGYYDVNVPATANAPAIQRLLDSGAYLVGTTKLACFAAREEPPECADYQAPYNPRGDGYQSPAGSSSGSAAAIASYDFLDFTIGSDSKFLYPLRGIVMLMAGATGSTRRPAFFNGCFALRPSYDKLPLDGMQLTFEYDLIEHRFVLKC
jgi:Asp-tRNA(Asn)/Glu-tRNA(Gln) amidotransferase A subunit family amidase